MAEAASASESFRVAMRRGCALPLLVLMCLGEASDSGTAACFPVPAGVVGWWPGDGDASDIVSTNDGTLQGGAEMVVGCMCESESECECEGVSECVVRTSVDE